MITQIKPLSIVVNPEGFPHRYTVSGDLATHLNVDDQYLAEEIIQERMIESNKYSVYGDDIYLSHIETDLDEFQQVYYLIHFDSEASTFFAEFEREDVVLDFLQFLNKEFDFPITKTQSVKNEKNREFVLNALSREQDLLSKKLNMVNSMLEDVDNLTPQELSYLTEIVDDFDSALDFNSKKDEPDVKKILSKINPYNVYDNHVASRT